MPNHDGPKVLLVMDHKGDVQFGGCPDCLTPALVESTLIEALRFLRAHPQGRDRLDGQW